MGYAPPSSGLLPRGGATAPAPRRSAHGYSFESYFSGSLAPTLTDIMLHPSTGLRPCLPKLANSIRHRTFRLSLPAQIKGPANSKGNLCLSTFETSAFRVPVSGQQRGGLLYCPCPKFFLPYTRRRAATAMAAFARISSGLRIFYDGEAAPYFLAECT